jgi:hypothetical protein
MRLIAERLLPDALGTTYVDGELISHELKALPPPTKMHKYHVCCSARNPGALALMHELAGERGFELTLSAEGAVDLGERRKSAAHSQSEAEVLFVTENTNRLAECDHLLLYLTSQTWTRGDEASEALADEVRRAMDVGVHVLLAHESARLRRPTRFPLLCPRPPSAHACDV